MSLLDDLQDESLKDSLANGNLRGEKSRAQRELENPIQSAWQNIGYHAQVMIFRCSCGYTDRRLQGIFRVDQQIKNADSVRFNAIPVEQIPSDAPRETRFSYFNTKVCVSCVGAYGFSPNA